jgi:hypothetical protein
MIREPALDNVARLGALGDLSRGCPGLGNDAWARRRFFNFWNVGRSLIKVFQIVNLEKTGGLKSD